MHAQVGGEFINNFVGLLSKASPFLWSLWYFLVPRGPLSEAVAQQLWEAGWRGRTEREKYVMSSGPALWAPAPRNRKGNSSLSQFWLLFPAAAPQNHLEAGAQEKGKMKSRERPAPNSLSYRTSFPCSLSQNEMVSPGVSLSAPSTHFVFTPPLSQARMHQRENAQVTTSSQVLGILVFLHPLAATYFPSPQRAVRPTVWLGSAEKSQLCVPTPSFPETELSA